MRVTRFRYRGLLLCALAAIQLATVGAGPFDWAKKIARTLTGSSVEDNEGHAVARNRRALLWLDETKYNGITPTRGSVLGWDLVTVTGCAFQHNISYELVFTASSNRSLSAGVHQWLSDSAITFLTTVWADHFTAVQAQVTLKAEGSAIELNATSTPFYSFDPLWYPETFAPTIGLAGGGAVVSMSGVGFSSQDFYSCRFSYLEDGWLQHEQEVAAQNVSSTVVVCVTPMWTFFAKSAAVALWRVPAAAGVAFNSSVLGSALALAVQEQVSSQGSVSYFKFLEVWSGVAPLSAGAAGGHAVTVTGIGWDPATTEEVAMPFGDPEIGTDRAYALLFDAGSASAEGSCAVASSSVLECQTPAWPAAAGAANLSVAVRYTFEDGFFRRRQQRIIGSVNATASLAFAFGAEWTALQPSVGDKLGGTRVTVRGGGFARGVAYQCNFTGVSEAREVLVSAVFASPEEVRCAATPEWSGEEWSAFSSVAALFTLLADGAPVATGGDRDFSFVFVNKPPAFTAQNLVVPGGEPPRNYSEPWLQFLSPGWFNGTAAADEGSQNTTFVVQTFPEDLFEVLPAVEGDSLTFTVAGTYVGVATVRVYVVDNGGTANGGSNTSAVQDYTITVLQYAKPPSFEVEANVTVPEHTLVRSPSFHFAGFVQHIMGPPDDLVQSVFLELSYPEGNASLALFARAPQVFLNGSLSFALAPWEFGAVVVALSAVAEGSVKVANFTIIVLPVNQAPSFALDPGAVLNMSALLEGSGAYVGPGLVANISKGPPVDNEDDQELTFRVVLVEGSAELFVPSARGEGNCSGSDAASEGCLAALNASLLRIDGNGTVSFEVAPFRHGTALFEATLRDDGGTAEGGDDTSLPQRFNVTVLPVNSAPSFDTVDVTLWEGAGNVSVRGVAVNLSAGSPTGDEDWQRLSFEVVEVGGGAGLFTGPVTVDANGTLQAALTPFAAGAARFEVRLVDDGGWERGGANASEPQNLSVTVLPVNQAPSFAIRPLLSLRENDAAYSEARFARNISRGSPTGNEDAQNVTFSVVLLNVTSTFSSAPRVRLSADGELSVALLPFEYGAAFFAVSLADDGGTERGGANESGVQLLKVDVLPVNDAPSFALQPRVRLFEGDGAVEVAGVASNISRGSPIGNEDAQNLTFAFTLRNGSLALFADGAVQLGPGGNLSLTLAPFEFGFAVLDFVLTDDGGSANGGANASAPQSLTIEVEPVNNAPAFAIAPFARVLVGTNFSSGRGSGVPLVTNVSAGSPSGNEDEQALSFSVVRTNGSMGLLSAPVKIAPDGFLTFVANEFDYGWVHFNVSLADDGGTAFGGANVSTPQPFAVHVVYVNHAPSFAIGDAHVEAWEGVDMAVRGFASNISKGSPTGSEDWQTLSFVVRELSSSAPMFQPNNVTISPDGDLFFALAAFENGVASFAVQLVDDGGTERGGENASAVAVFNVTVLAVNNRPSFALSTPVTVLEGSGAVSIGGVASGISRGSPNGNEDAQNVSFSVEVLNSTAPLFAAPNVSLGPDGVLSFALAPYEFGSATLVVVLEDDGGTERGGENASLPQLLTVEVLPVNDRPSFEASDHTVWEDSGRVRVDGLAFNIERGPPAPIGNEAGQAVTFQLEFVNGSLGLFEPFSFASAFDCVNASLLPANATVLNGSQSANASCGAGFVQTQALFSPRVANRVRLLANGTMAFSLAADEFGTARVALRLKDDGGVANGGEDVSREVQATITVLPVNDAPSFALGDGDCLGGIVPVGCSENLTTIIVRRNAFLVGESYRLAAFAEDVSVGPPNEAAQQLSFEVVPRGGDALVAAGPSVDANGTLQLTQLADAVGEAVFAVRAVDSGGVARGGEDTSDYARFRVVVVSGLVEAEVFVDAGAAEVEVAQFVRNVSRAVSVPLERIAITAIADLAPPQRRLLQGPGAQISVAVFLLTDDPAVLQSVALLLRGLTALPGVASVNTTLAPVDEGDSSTFSLIAPAVTVYENQGAHAVAALTDIFSATEQFNAFGEQVVNLFVLQVNGSNASDLFSAAPSIAPAICNRNETCTAEVSFATRPTANGEAWFLVRQAGSSVIRTLRIAVLPVNQPPVFDLSASRVVLDEDTAAYTLPRFAVNISRGPADEAAQLLSFQVVPVATTGPLFFDGTPMPGTTNLSDWLVATISIDPADGSLHVGLVPFALGNVTFQVVLVDDGGVVATNSSVLGDDTSAAVNFTVSAVPVNHEPSFHLGTLHLEVAEDCAPLGAGTCSGATYAHPGFAAPVAAGPPNEAVQALSFTVVPIDCQVPRFSAGTWRNASRIYTDGCPPDLTFPGTSPRSEVLFASPVEVSPNGTLAFSLAGDRHGIVRFEVWLRDDGATLRGGDDRSPTLSFAIEILRVNDAPSFVLAATALTVNQDCMGYSPSLPYPNGWTWSSDPVACALEQGEGNFRDGCWLPLWACDYAPLGLGTARRLLSAGNASAADPSCPNSTLFPACACDPSPGCACACDNLTFWGEVLLVEYTLAQLTANQLAVTTALAAAFSPLEVPSSAVHLRSATNLTELPYEKEATRSLLAQRHGVSLLFSVPLLFDPAQTAFLASIPDAFRSLLQAAGVPEAAVVGWEVVPAGVDVETRAAFCSPPEPPPRVQCQDGSFVLEDLVRRVRKGGWGEENENIWFVVDRVSGPDIGAVDVRFPVRNVSQNAIFEFTPTDGRFGVSEYNITIFDSGGTDNGGVDSFRASQTLRITVLGQNLPPAFAFASDVLFYSQDSACVETPQGGCDGFCDGGDSLCVGGRDDGLVCSGAGTCAGNCSGGAHIPVSVSCLGTCSCPVVLDGSVEVVDPSCNPAGTLGVCACEAPNTDARCTNSSDCTGGGACTDVGACTAPGDDQGNCTLSEQCSNGGECVPRFLPYLRHLHRARAVGISAGSATEDGADSCPAGTSLGNGCAFQSVTFTVTPLNLTLASAVFSELPALSATGDLTFNLTAGAFGAVAFEVTLRDDSGDATSDTSAPQTLLIGIAPVNAEPSFDIPTSITVLEDSGPYEGHVAFNIQSPNSIGSIVTIIEFRVACANPGLFSVAPSIDDDGVLSFTPAADAFGETLCDVTLLDFSRPDAGDAQFMKPLTLIVQPVNDQPTVTRLNAASTFTLPINSGVTTEPLFGNIQPGPPNEACAQRGDGCENQAVSFIVVGIANPLLFLWFPTIDAATGELTFRVKPDATGLSSVTLGVIDDGFDLSSQVGCVHVNQTSFMGVSGTGADAPCLIDPAFEQAGGPSLLTTFGVQVYAPPEGNKNDLRVLYEVNCSGIEEESECTCPPLTESTVDANLVPVSDPVCSLLSGAVADDFLPTRAEVIVEGDQGPKSIENFAAIVREEDYLEGSLAIFSVNVDGSNVELEFIERRQDAERATPGLEYATDVVYSPDGKNAYAVEPETDSISIWKRDPATAPRVPEGGGEPLQFMSRRAYGEQRVRFGGLVEPPNLDVAPTPVLTPALCGLRALEVGGVDLVAMAAGCEDPALDMDLQPNSTWRGGSAEALVGYWEFTTTALYGDHVPGEFDAFGALDWTTTTTGGTANPATPNINCLNRWCLAAVEATGTVSCRPGFGCSYSRPAVSLPNCREPGLGLTVYPATVENGAARAHADVDSGEVLPALLFPGPKCRSAPGALDWMAAPAPMSPVNFIANNGRYEAMQFDGALNPGLFLTNDIRTLVDRDPALSKLPREHMSVEAWVTVDAQEYLSVLETEYRGVIFGAASGRVASESSLTPGTCNKGWLLSYGLTVGPGGGSLSFRLQISLEKNEGNNGVGAFEVAEAFATFPSPCSCADLGISGSPCSCFAGRWHHVVATYDGTFLEVYVNGELKRRKQACSEAPCGGIVYPADYHPTSDAPTTACTANGPVPVTIGNYTDRTNGETRAHKGLIKHVALFKRALTPSEVEERFQHEMELYKSPVHLQRYWGKVPGISPSIDFFDASSLGGRGSTTFTVKGVFRSDSVYQCMFVVDALTNTSVPATVEPTSRTLSFGGVANDNSLELFGDRDTLSCTTPEWHYGARAVQLLVVEDGAALWQKLCVQPECGFESLVDRASSPTTHPWTYLTPSPADFRTLVPCSPDAPSCASAVLAPSAHGSRTTFRFTTESPLFTWDAASWTAEAPVQRVVVTAGGAGYTSGTIVSTAPQGWSGYDPAEFAWYVEAVDGVLQLGAARPGPGAASGRYPPGFAGVEWFVAFGPDCAASREDCLRTPQAGRVTDIFVFNASRTAGCSAAGRIFSLDDAVTGGGGFQAMYTVSGGQIVNISFATAAERGENFTAAPTLNISDPACTCDGGQDWSACITVRVNTAPAVFSQEAALGFQHVSNFAVATEGVFGKVDCTTIAGCAPDRSTHGVLGASAFEAFVDEVTGETVVVVANYHDWERKEVNSTVFVLKPSTLEPVVVQQVETAAATDVHAFTVAGSSMRLVGFANFHGPAVLYKWAGSAPVTAFAVVSAGQGYVAGSVGIESAFGAGFAATFEVVDGAVSGVSISAPGTGYFPDAEAKLYFAAGCAVDDSACTAVEMTGAVVGIEVVNASRLTNCSDGQLLVDAEGIGRGLAARLSVDGSGGVSVVFPDAYSHGRGYSPLDVVLVADFTPPPNDPNATSSCTCGGSLELGACLAPQVAWKGKVAPLPLTSAAVPIAEVQLASGGSKYVPGRVRAVSMSGSGFRMAFAADAASGAVTALTMQHHGDGYFPETELELFYGALCAFNDERCGSTRMTGSVTKVVILDASGITGCAAEGNITLAGGGGSGFVARFQPLVSSGQMGRIYFVEPEDHGMGYDPALSAALRVSRESGCACFGGSDFAPCLSPWIASGAALLPSPQRALRPEYCPAGECADLEQRAFRHPFHPETQPRAAVPLDLTRPFPLDAAGPVALESFDVNGSTFVAVACFYDAARDSFDTPSKVFRLTAPAAGPRSLEVAEVAALPTRGARDVLHFQDPAAAGWHWLLVTQDGPESLLFASQDGVAFELAQRVPLRGGGRLLSFREAGQTFVLAAERDADTSSLLRFNGSHLLGEQDTAVLPKDSAGGQLLPSARATAFARWETAGVEYMLLGNGNNCSFAGLAAPAGCSGTTVFSSLFRQAIEDPLPLAGARSAIVTPDGLFVYVAGYASNALAAFDRDPATGELSYNPAASFIAGPVTPHYQVGGDLPQEGGDFPTLQGVTSVVASPDGATLYAAAASEGAVYVLARDATSGVLTLLQVLRDGEFESGKVMDSLAGAASLAVTAGAVYVAAQVDQAVSVFDRNPDGTLSYVDRVRAGERVLTQFEQPIDETAGPSWTSSSAPRRLQSSHAAASRRLLQAGNASVPDWLASARKTVPFEIGGSSFMAVAAGRDTPGGGTVAVYRWNEADEAFEFLQTTGSRDPSPADIAFVVEDSGAVAKELLVVANTEGNTHVYLWRDGGFLLYQTVPITHPDGRDLPPYVSSGLPTCARAGATTTPVPSTVPLTTPAENDTVVETPAPFGQVYNSEFLTVPLYTCVPTAMAQRIEVFKIDGTSYLGIAYVWDQPASQPYKWYSLVYRWNRDGFAVLEDGSREQGFGFDMYQILPTSGATDMEFIAVPDWALPPSESGLNLLVVANLLHGTDPASFESETVVWRHSRSAWNPLLRSRAGAFELWQAIPTKGAYGLHHFTVPYAAASAGELLVLGIASRQAGETDYTPASQLWAFVDGAFTLLQELGNVFGMTGISSLQEGREVHLIVSVSCNSTCQDFASSANATLRRRALQAGSEPITSSSILQWDQRAGAFVFPMALTDTEHEARFGMPVPDDERGVHSGAVLLQVPGVVHVAPVTVGPVTLLVLSSAEEGVVLVEWDFPAIAGLEGVNLLLPDPGDGLLLAVGEVSRALVRFRREPQVDSLGQTLSELTWEGTVGEDPLEIDRLSSSDAALVQGLAGGQRLELYPPGCALLAANCSGAGGNASCGSAGAAQCEFLLVHGSAPRHSLPCGDAPPVSAVLPEQLVATHVPALCSDPVVVVEQTATDSEGMFAVPPAIEDGTLTFEPREGAFGTAEFRAFVLGSDFEYEFAITVNPVRYPPTFEPVDVTVLEDAGVQVLQFARNIQTGRADATREHLLRMHFEVTLPGGGDCDLLDPVPATLPWIGTVYVDSDGNGYGALRFEWQAHRWGTCEVSAVLIDPQEADPEAQRSPEVSFRITALPVNDPPTFTLRFPVAPEMEQGAPLLETQEFVYLDGSDAGGLLGFTLGPYEDFCEEPRVLHRVTPCPCTNGAYLFDRSIPCEYNFTIAQIERQVSPGQFVEDRARLFLRFEINYVGDLKLLLDPGRFGTFRITLQMMDDGGSRNGGIDRSFESFMLTVKQQIVPPSVEGYTEEQYRPLRLPLPLPEVPEEEADALMMSFADLAIDNITAINLTVPEMHVAVRQVYDDFLTHFMNGPPDQEAANTLHLSVVHISNDFLFMRNENGSCAGCPQFNVGGRMGTLAFELVPFEYGVSTIEIELISIGEHGNVTSTFEIDLIVVPVNNPPSAALPEFLGLVEGSGLVEIPMFATNISVGPANEQWQQAMFSIQSEVDTPFLLQDSPAISYNGTLVLNLTEDRHGEGELSVMLHDSGGTFAGGRNAALGFPRTLPLKVFPLPRVVSLSPCVGPVRAGWTVTVFGQYFGSQYSRNTPWGTNTSSYEDVAVLVGGEPCSRQVFVSDTQLLCDMPPGRGRRGLDVSVPGGVTVNANGEVLSHWNRTGVYAPGVVQADLYYVGGATGVTETESAGLVAFGPDMAVRPAETCAGNASDGNSSWANASAAWNANASQAANETCRAPIRPGQPASLSVVPGVGLTRSVRAVMPFEDRVVLGGSFLGLAARHLSYIVSWDGAKVAALAGGVDGTVNSLDRWQGLLVVGGAFSLLYGDQTLGQQTLKSGGLGLWDGVAWSMAGGAVVHGAVTCSHVQGSVLYVAGRFRKVGNTSASNIARFDGGRWSALGEGLRARDVLAMAGTERDLFVAGEIAIAGQVQVGNLARWLVEEEEWRPMKEFNGMVRALALVGNRLFVGGDFSLAGVLPAGAVAQTEVVLEGDAEVEWREMGSVGGSVHAMRYYQGCLYVGGRFDTVAGREGVLAARNAARWCVEGAAEQGETWEPVVGMGGEGGVVLDIAAADFE